MRERRLRWFGHVERSSGAIRTACDIQIEDRRGAGRPKLTWKKLTERDCREWKLMKAVTRKTGNDLLTGKRRKLPENAGKRRKTPKI